MNFEKEVLNRFAVYYEGACVLIWQFRTFQAPKSESYRASKSLSAITVIILQIDDCM